MEQVSGLQTEVSTLKEDYQNKEEALKRENEVLRDQLKKYVSLVQAQRKETITKQTSSEGSVCVCLYSVRSWLLYAHYHKNLLQNWELPSRQFLLNNLLLQTISPSVYQTCKCCHGNYLVSKGLNTHIY